MSFLTSLGRYTFSQTIPFIQKESIQESCKSFEKHLRRTINLLIGTFPVSFVDILLSPTFFIIVYKDKILFIMRFDLVEDVFLLKRILPARYISIFTFPARFVLDVPLPILFLQLLAIFFPSFLMSIPKTHLQIR